MVDPETSLGSAWMCNAATHWVGTPLSQPNLLLSSVGGGRDGVARGTFAAVETSITCTLEIRRQWSSEAAEAESIMTVGAEPEGLDLGTRGG
jgi:hypothetical protein